jgi:hypothetical protein
MLDIRAVLDYDPRISLLEEFSKLVSCKEDLTLQSAGF